MPSPDSKTRARTQLAELIKSHLNTLEKETFGCISQYEGRREHLSALR